ncbi:hypothetical protein AB0P41_01800 [Streptomyces sp. NPDC079167]|uniref:hypothetical protein n=1 Tax=Streptomyces sp. NPDC079167 TaxID=3154513 RepID=UPI00344430C0
MFTKKVLVILGAVTLGGSVLVGCGEDSGGSSGSDKAALSGKSADEIAAAAVKATRDAESVHIVGTSQQQGQEMKLDFIVDNKDNCTGTLTGPEAEADVLQVGETTYVRGEKKFWENLLKAQGAGSDQAVDKLAGKWVKSDPDEAGAEGMCDKQAVIAAMDSDKSERMGMKKGEQTEVNGKDALALTKKADDGEVITLYVAAKGEPYIMKAVSKGGENPSETTLTDYNKKVDAKEPPANEVVDPKQVQS